LGDFLIVEMVLGGGGVCGAFFEMLIIMVIDGLVFWRFGEWRSRIELN
jgi:hypothetical protein